tara:strand:- start:419 stop:1333 length:915 start_codon:yes stop_codon:yes gene_type:complete
MIVIDVEKRRIEARYINKIRPIFKQINKDAIALYRATKNIPSDSLARNYTPDFLKVIKDALRETIQMFGYNERKPAIKSVSEIPDDELDKINREFEQLAILFIASESERQAIFIQNTNARELSDAQLNGIVKYTRKEARLIDIIQKLKEKLSRISFANTINGTSVNLSKLEAKIKEYEDALENLRQEKEVAIEEAIKEELEDQEDARAELIASVVVGSGESWSREQEMLLIAGALTLLGKQVFKTWQGILDGRIRLSHFAATGQKVPVNQDFIVGGYQASRPRDPRLPMSEVANCRCVVSYSVV